MSLPTTYTPPTMAKLLAQQGLLGSLALLILFGIFSVWSIFAPLASAVITTGTVVVRENTQIAQAIEGGAVSGISVRDGDEVEAGSVVLRLDSSRFDSMLETLRSQLALLAAQKARNIAEFHSDKAIEFPSFTNGIALLDYQYLLDAQRDIFTARKDVLDIHLRELDVENHQATAMIDGLERQIELLRVRLNLSREDVAATSELAQSGSGTKRAQREAYSSTTTLLGDLAAVQLRQTELREKIVRSGVEGERLKASFREANQTDLQQIEKEQQDTQQRYHEALISKQHCLIRAPAAGTVFNMAVHTIGQFVGPGATILEVVPRDETLIIEVQLRPMDVDEVSLGSPVKIRAQGGGAQRLPTVAGRIAWISADRILDKQRGNPYFAARIEIDQVVLAKLRNTPLRPGIPLEVMITKKGKTVMEYLLAPIYSAFSHAMKE